MDDKVNISCKLLEDFESKYDVIGRIHEVTRIAYSFSRRSQIEQEIEKASVHISRLTSIKERYRGKFYARKNKS